MAPKKMSSAASSLSLGQWAACGFTGLLIASSLGAYTYFSDTVDFATESVDPSEWGDRPPEVDSLNNILLLGTDERAEDDAQYNEENGVRPDVLAIVSIDVDNEGVTIVNLPRDLVVDLPACEARDDYEGTPGGEDQLNHAMRYGGLDCQGNAVETATGVHLDHMVAVDFAGFENIVDTLGGVEMCVPEPVEDPLADLELDAGEQELDGHEALGLARSRDSTDHGSDLGRIENQQRLIGAILREVTDGDILSSPATLQDFLGSVTDNMVTDDTLNLQTMVDLATAMREIDLEEINMVTAPVVDHPVDPNKVDFDEPAAGELLEAVAAGETVDDGDDADDGAGDESGDDGGDGSDGAEPSDVSVQVFNNTGMDGLAQEVEAMLTDEGFTVTDTGNPEERVPEGSTVYHGPEQADEAELLASALTTAQVEEVPELGEELELVMSSDWGPVVGADGGGDGDGDGSGALSGLEGSSAAEDEVSCD